MILKLATLTFGFCFAVTFAGSAAVSVPVQPGLTAAEIVNKNVTARGGLQAWRAVQSISLQGKLGVGGDQRATLPEPLPGKKASVLPTDPRPAAEIELPFLMELERPLKARFELQFKGQTAVQIFDGTNGWKMRPYLNRQDVEPYTADELKKASMQAELDGPLIDYAAKGTRVDLDGTEKVEGKDTYRIKLTLKGGQITHVWVDAHNFLEAKVEGQPRRLDGIDHQVEVYYRDYHAVNGLQIPFVLETRVLSAATAASSRVKETPVPAERILVEKVLVNPRLEASLFAKPELPAAKLSVKQVK